MRVLKGSVIGLGLLLQAGVVAAVDFRDPNTSFFSVENFTYFDGSEVQHFNVAGYYTRAAGDVPARVAILPRLGADISRLEVIDRQGRMVPGGEVADASQISVLRIPLRYRGALPNASEGAAVAAQVSGNPIASLHPEPLLNGGFPVVYPPAQMSPTGGMVISDTQQYMAQVQAQKQFLDEWQRMRVETASMDELAVRLVIDGEIVSERRLSGSAVLSSGTLPQLHIREPTTEQYNRLREGTYEVDVSYYFRDFQTGSIVANYDFRRFMSQFVERSRQAVTTSRSSGWSIFNIGSRRTSVRQHVRESDNMNSTFDSRTNTVVEMVDADEALIEQFERRFFPPLSQQQVVENHLAAAREADAAGNAELAKAHRDYVAALNSGDKDSEMDAVGAAAALASGNYALFVAKGVRFSSSSSSMADSFHQVLSAQSQESGGENWTSSHSRSARRRVSVWLTPSAERAYRPWMGICHLQFVSGHLYGQPHVYVVPTCLANGGPAHRAGLWPGMWIARMGGRSIRNLGQMEQLLEQYEPDETLVLDVLGANNQLERLQLRLGQGLEIVD